MLTNLTNALNKTINYCGGSRYVTGSVIQADNEPVWYVSFLTSCGGTLLLEVIWRDGGIVASLLEHGGAQYKLSDRRATRIIDYFLDSVDDSDMPPCYDYDESDEMPALDT
jgi:hypothetical protein